MMNGAGIALAFFVAWGQSAPTPASTPEPKYYLIQVRIIEVDEQGKQIVVATPSLQTTGDATGVTVDPKRGRKFEFHFSAIDPNAPATQPKMVSEESTGPKPVITADALKPEKMATQRVSVKAVQQSRQEILKAIAEQAGMHLVLDADTVAATAGSLLTPISLELQNTPVEDAIRQITEPAKLNFSMRQDLVLIGASPLKPAANSGPILIPPSTLPGTVSAKPLQAPVNASTLSVRVYAVQDLVQIDSETQRPVFKSLIEQLQKTVGGEAWDNQGGMATIRGFDSTVSLVVRQTPAGHDAVTKHLADLRAKTATPEK